MLRCAADDLESQWSRIAETVGNTPGLGHAPRQNRRRARPGGENQPSSSLFILTCSKTTQAARSVGRLSLLRPRRVSDRKVRLHGRDALIPRGRKFASTVFHFLHAASDRCRTQSLALLRNNKSGQRDANISHSGFRAIACGAHDANSSSMSIALLSRAHRGSPPSEVS
jgi:hypothetical protein